jgi:uncharacterized protein (TIGR00725 family)
MPAATQRPIVGVMGSGNEPCSELAKPLGELLARLGVNLLTGGGGGVMSGVSEAFTAVAPRQGLAIGILPCQENDPLCGPKPGYPNPWVELPIKTHLALSGPRGAEPMSRNHVNVLSSDAVVVLPGEAGTTSEVELAIRYGRPVIAWLGDHKMPLPAEVRVAHTLDDVEQFLRSVLPLDG